jgi:hypothetical protein
MSFIIFIVRTLKDLPVEHPHGDERERQLNAQRLDVKF